MCVSVCNLLTKMQLYMSVHIPVAGTLYCRTGISGGFSLGGKEGGGVGVGNGMYTPTHPYPMKETPTLH